jgi:hypothetical protein
LWAWCGLNQRGDTVGGERRVLERVIEELGEDGGLVAPWSWGARASVLATGDPYGLRWRPPEGFVRDQARGWCGAPPIRVASLPPGASWAVGGEPDQYGVYWSFEAPTEGCPR